MFPSKPWYSAGARASMRVTSGEPSRPRTSEVVSRVRFGPRTVNPFVGAGVRPLVISPSFCDPLRVAAIEHAHRLQAIGSQAPPGTGREQPLPVVVDDDGRAVARSRSAARPRPSCPGRPTGSCRHPRRRRRAPCASPRGRHRRCGPSRGPAARCRRAASGASTTRTPGRSEILGQPFGRGEELRAGQATHGRYHTGVVDPFLPDPEKLDGGPHGDPVARRRDLPQHRLGRAAPGRDGSGDGRHGRLRTRRRPGPSGLLRRVHAVGWPRRVPASRRSSGRTSAAVALNHSTTDGMNAATLCPTGARATGP